MFDEEGGKLIPADDVGISEFLHSRFAGSSVELVLGVQRLADRPSFLIRVDMPPIANQVRTPGLLSVWQFSRRPSLEAMSLTFECPSCRAWIPDESARPGAMWACPGCQELWPQHALNGFTAYEGNYDMWGTRLAQIYDSLGGLAEVMIMRRKYSIRKLAMDAVNGGQAQIDAFANSRLPGSEISLEGAYYTMRAIHKDMESGTGLARLVSVFLKGG